MSTTREPNPPSRKEEDFPKTNTIPDGWIMDALMEAYNGAGSAANHGTEKDEQGVPVPATGNTVEKVNGKAHHAEPAQETAAAKPTESLFSRRLDPFPSAWDLSGMGL